MLFWLLQLRLLVRRWPAGADNALWKLGLFIIKLAGETGGNGRYSDPVGVDGEEVEPRGCEMNFRFAPTGGKLGRCGEVIGLVWKGNDKKY